MNNESTNNNHKFEEIFKYTLPFINFNELISEKFCLFVTNSEGKLAGKHSFGLDCHELDINILNLVKNHKKNNEVEMVEGESHITFLLPIFDEEQIVSVLGIAFDNVQNKEKVVSFLNYFRTIFLMSQKIYLEHVIDEITELTRQYLDIDTIMNTIVMKIPELLNKGDCTAGVLDREQETLILKWSNSETFLSQYMLKPLVTDLPNDFKDEDIIKFSQEILGQIIPSNQHYIVPIYYVGTVLGIFSIHLKEGKSLTKDEAKFLHRLANEIATTINHTYVYNQIEREAKKQESLFEMSKKIQSSIDVEEVLKAVMKNINTLYPMMQVELYLSTDFASNDIQIKPFDMNEYNSCTQAFMEGRIIIDYSESKLTVASPLRGKQGVYGVFELVTHEKMKLSEQDAEYITILSDTAGNAFENAQLYEQSQNLIRNLLIINEITHQLNKTLKLNEILNFMTNKLTNTYNSEYCCILQKKDDAFLVQSSVNPKHVRTMLPINQARMGELYKKKKPILIGTNSQKDSPEYELHPCESLIAVPLINDNETIGAIMLMDSRPNYFSFDDLKLMEILGQHLSMAISNATLHAEVERMVITDNLTKLYNRKFLEDKVRSSFATDRFGALIMIDIDHFKKVNDTYGHDGGDAILRQVAQILKSSIRDSDFATRWGGEEMAIYLPQTNLEIAMRVAERVRKNVEETTNPKVTCSLGVATWNLERDFNPTVEWLFKRSDEPLYEAKQGGRNRWIVSKDERNMLS